MNEHLTYVIVRNNEGNRTFRSVVRLREWQLKICIISDKELLIASVKKRKFLFNAM